MLSLYNLLACTYRLDASAIVIPVLELNELPLIIIVLFLFRSGRIIRVLSSFAWSLIENHSFMPESRCDLQGTGSCS